MIRNSLNTKLANLSRAALAGLLAAALAAAAPAPARADIGSALKKSSDGVQKGTKDLKTSIEGARDRHITKPTTPDEFAKVADVQLKEAQALMFKDDPDGASAGLLEAAGTILALKEKAPEHEKLKGLENRANKMAGEMKTKTGKDADIWAEAKKKAEDAKAAAEKKAAEEKAAAEKKAEEAKATAEKDADETKAAAEKKTEDAAAAVEKKAEDAAATTNNQ